MRKDFEVYVPADVQTLPALPPFEEFEECMYTSPLGYTAVHASRLCCRPV